LPAQLTFRKKKLLNQHHFPHHQTPQSFLPIVGTLPEKQKTHFIHQLLPPLAQNLMLTPNEVDTFIDDMPNVLPNGLN
ncbi:GPR endopeptidase, partial [Bacillus altitudinis]|uniref:GPR endopeptidase n=1 Tax=Bacillus altitudinis TaxID=293387 RepID=UPI0011A9B69A